jgi:acetyl esterase/lipase
LTVDDDDDDDDDAEVICNCPELLLRRTARAKSINHLFSSVPESETVYALKSPQAQRWRTEKVLTMSSPPTLPSWTPQQATALHGLRTALGAFAPTFGQAQSITERSQIPSEGIPNGVHISCEFALPSSQIPASIHSTSIQPGRVPIFLYSSTLSESADAKNDTKVILHVHGGGGVSGHPADQRFVGFFSRMLHALGEKSAAQGSSTPIIAAPSYRLATVAENLCPAALQDLFSAYHHLISQGFVAENITITGDSAGGTWVRPSISLSTPISYLT